MYIKHGDFQFITTKRYIDAFWGDGFYNWARFAAKNGQFHVVQANKSIPKDLLELIK